jgi:hypothetical protein
VFTVTLTDGTSAAFTVKNGSTGKPGTSVTVKSVTESTEDGGSNVVEFSDGKTLTVKNGKKGADGKNPVKGVDYWTDAEQEAMVQQVLTALGTPVFGRVEEGNKITLSTEHLADGTYELGYEDENGNWVKICDYIKDSEPGQSYTNLLTAAVGYDGNVLNGTGYADGYRLTGDAGVSGQLSYQSALTGYFMTGFMPITMEKIENDCSIYVKGVSLTAEDGNVRALVAPEYNYTEYINNVKIMNSGAIGVSVTELSDKYYRIDLSYNFLTNGNYPHSANPAFTDIKYFKLSLAGSGEGVIVTVNEPIVDEEPNYTNRIPSSVDDNDNIYGEDYNGDGVADGYKENTRVSGGVDTNSDGVFITGYIPVEEGDVLYLKNVTMPKGGNYTCRAVIFNAKKVDGGTSSNVTDSSPADWVWDENNNAVSFKIPLGYFTNNEPNRAAFVRVQASYIGADSVITINEPIE